MMASSMMASSTVVAGSDANIDGAVLIENDVSAVDSATAARAESADEQLARKLQESELNAANNAIHRTMMKDYAERRIYR